MPPRTASSPPPAPAYPAHAWAGQAAYVLVGPTAVGKSAVAQRIAEQDGLAILSADSMLVYRGMDLGTAKPTIEERGHTMYAGLDLAAPDEPFSVGRWLVSAREAFRDAERRGRILLVVGGSGLYVKALLLGLDETPAPDSEVRGRVEAVFQAEGVNGLRDRLRAAGEKHLQALADPDNPRRLMRALELAWVGADVPGRWGTAERPRVVGLRMEAAGLERRIRERVRRMYAAGLVDEVRDLITRYPGFSSTAGAAIGYAEAAAVARGQVAVEDAMALTERRTRRLAKRQMTWFRRQFEVRWIDAGPAGDLDSVCESVRTGWCEQGPSKVLGLQRR